MADLSNELQNQSAFKTSSKEPESKLESKTNNALDQLQKETAVKEKQIQAQDKSQQAQLGKGGKSEAVAEAMAGLMQEEELGDSNEVQKELEEKMKILMEKAEAFQDVELDNEENNYELQQMFKNADKFQSLKRREGKLNKQIEDLEIELKQQETREELNKLPVDESTKVRDQLRINYDHQQDLENQTSNNHDQGSDQSQNNEKEGQEEHQSQGNKKKIKKAPLMAKKRRLNSIKKSQKI